MHPEHKLPPFLAILDEVGQVPGPHDAFIEANKTAEGALAYPLIITISAQSATDADLFSIRLDDAATPKDRRIVSHVYSAPKHCELSDHKA